MEDEKLGKFAPHLPRDEHGWILFPSDVSVRKKLFTTESMQHPAKMNLHLENAIVEYVSKAGEKILDPMSGTGSVMMATLKDRLVYLIEDAPVFHYMQVQNKAMFVASGVPEDSITLLLGPCQDYLPMQGFFDHVIFSPPYSDMLKSLGGGDFIKSMFPNWDGDSLEDYLGGTEKNLGRMSAFFYNQEMAKVYKLLFDSLRQGGTMTVVLRDQMKGGKRLGLADWVMRTCVKTGFEMLYWVKRECGNTGFKQRNRSRGFEVISDEDIIGFTRP